MNSLRLILSLSIFFHLHSSAAEAPPEKALKYHEVLLKRPSNETLFDRFFNAWIDEQDITQLEAFLIARADENGGADLSVLARYHLRRGNEEAALASLAKAITATPADVSLPMERAKILLRRLDFKNARTDLATVAAGTDAALSLEASKLIGKSWMREGNSKEAIKAWDTLLAAHPNDEDLLEDLVESAAAEGETDQALKYVDKLIATGADPYKKVLRQLRRGDLLAQAGRHDDAIAAYSATIADVGEGSWLEREVIAQIDKAFRKQDRIDDLKTKLIELAEANPRRLLIHRELARIEAAQGQTDSAVGRFREVLKRSPGNRELREEFIRLLTDGEKYEEAVTELEKLITASPEDSGLLLQMADLRNREGNKEATLSSLQKAHTLLGKDETAGIRIASLMFQYELAEAGEQLLTKLATEPTATEAPSEALAAEYSRTNRKPEALVILQKVAASKNLETLLRSAASISALSESETALKILTSREQDFGNEARFLTAISQAALANGKPDVAITHSLKLVRLAAPGTDLSESIGLALRSIIDAKKTDEWRTTLEKQESRTPAETCLLAALADSQNDFDAVTKIMTGATDPTVIRFHAAILDRRNEFEEAISVLASLATTDEGRKTSYFKDMAELQRRAGLTEDALATIELWKQSAPGDKTAWVIGSSILREEGRTDDAVKATRMAVTRFEQDTDLAATLASLHAEAGQMEEAEAIYWRLYDNSANPSDHSRWAVSLAELAMNSGRTEELSEKLRERARNNRQAIGPILAQAELARVTRDEEKRRDLLLEAVRLQPKDIDLRLQIANIEEQNGNPDRVIAILEEAVPLDTSNRIRSALAHAYLRQGQTLKGIRELRAMAGKQADDPRNIEQSVAALAGSGLYDEAIQYFRDALPNGGDWRSKYLLAIMLEQDGRESEAIPIFQSLLQASGDLNISKPTTQSNNYYFDQFQGATRDIMSLMGDVQAAYAHRENNSRNYINFQNSNNRVGPFTLPDTTKSVRNLSLIHLAKLDANNSEVDPFLKELIASSSPQETNFPALLSKFPNQPGLLEIVLLYASWNGDGASGLDLDLLRKVLSERKNLSPSSRFQGLVILASEAKATETTWEELTTASSELVLSKNKNEISATAYQLLSFLSAKEVTIPEKYRPTLASNLLKLASKEEIKDGPFNNFKIMALNNVGTPEQWVEAVNEELENFRKESSNNKQLNNSSSNHLGFMFRSGYGGNESPFILPSLDNIELTSLPSELTSMFSPNSGWFYYFESEPVQPTEILKNVDSFSSPLLRAYVAMRANNKEAIEKYISVTPPELEAADFAYLNAVNAISNKDFSTAYKLLADQRPSRAANRSASSSLNIFLLSIAAEMTPKQRTEIAADLEPLLIQANRHLGPQQSINVAALADRLELPELAKRFRPRNNNQPANLQNQIGAIIGRNNSSSPSNSSVEKLKKFSDEGKHEAAALEALQLIRKTFTNSYGNSYEMNEIREAVTPEVLKEIFKLIDPGDSKSLTKLTEYADICIEFNKPEQALEVLNRLIIDRPNDSSVAAKLAFILPIDQRERIIELLNKSATDEKFASIAFSTATKISSKRQTKPSFAFFETIAVWLESTPPEDLIKANLSWVAYHSKDFFEGSFSGGSISSINDTPKNSSPEQTEFSNISKRLALAMLKHPNLSEQGFRLLRSGSIRFKTPEQELDNHARNVLLGAASIPANPYGNYSFFSFRDRNSSQSSGDSLDELSSVNWITARLSKAKSPNEILPENYITDLSAKNPKFGELLAALASLNDVKQLEKLWDSDSLSNASNNFIDMLSDGVFTRAQSIPNAGSFFIARVNEIKPGRFEEHEYNSNITNQTLAIAALKTSSSLDQKQLTELCSTLSKAIFGEQMEFKTATNEQAMMSYQALNTLQNILQSTELDIASSSRILSTFYRLGIPVGTNEYSIMRSGNSLAFGNIKEAEKTLESLGWLASADTYEPLAAIYYNVNSNSNSNQLTFTRSETFLPPSLFSYANLNFSRSDLAKQLESRKPQTFGSLITAASLADEEERQRLTSLAFSTEKTKLASLSNDRVKAISLLLPWLPEKDIATLPANFRSIAEKNNSEKLTSLHEKADAFLKQEITNNQHNDIFREASDLVIELAPLDLPKAVEIFLTAERRFTENPNKNRNWLRTTGEELNLNERDSALFNLYSDSDSPFYKDPVLALSFYKAIATSPEAARFTFASSGSFTPTLFTIGYNFNNSIPYSQNNSKEPQWLKAFTKIESFPEEIRNEAYLCLCIYLIGKDYPILNRKNLPPVPNLNKLHKNAIDTHAVFTGLQNRNTDTPKQKELTQQTILSLATNNDFSPVSRFQFLSLAVIRYPELLSNIKIAETFANMYEEYTSSQRSAVNSLAIHSNAIIRRAEVNDQNKPFLSRINKAFWENANSSNKGGHSVIPPNFADSLLIAATRVGDAATSKKLLAQAKPVLEGNATAIHSLISSGNFEIAKAILAPQNKYYPAAPTLPPYTKSFEDRLNEFRTSQNIDPISMLRIEALFMDLSFAPTSGKDIPSETDAQREQRIATTYLANPPKNILLRTEIVSRLIRDSHTAAIALRPEVLALRKELDLKKALTDWHKGVGKPTDPAPRYIVGPSEAVIFRQAAFLLLLDGDASGLTELADTISALETSSEWKENGNRYYIKEYLSRVHVSAPIWICEAVHLGKTDGFAAAFDAFKKLALISDEREEFDTWEMTKPLTMAELLAHWDGNGDKINQLFKKIKRNKNNLSYLNQRWGLLQFCKIAKEHRTWNHPDFAEKRHDFLIKAFTKPQMKDYYGNVRWLPLTADLGMRDDLLRIAVNPPENILNTALAPLLNFNANEEFKAKRLDSGIASAKAAIDACPNDKPWQAVRFDWQLALIDRLIGAKNIDQANEIYTSIIAKDLNKDQTKKYAAFGTKLENAKK